MIDLWIVLLIDPGIDAIYGGQGRSAFPIYPAYAQGAVTSRKTSLSPVPGIAGLCCWRWAWAWPGAWDCLGLNSGPVRGFLGAGYAWAWAGAEDSASGLKTGLPGLWLAGWPVQVCRPGIASRDCWRWLCWLA